MNTLKLKSPYNRRGSRVADHDNNMFNGDSPARSAPLDNNLQDATLERMQDSLVTVYLVSGIRLSGVLKQFDAFTLLLQGTDEVLVFKHAISTIVPGAVERTIRKERRW